MFTDFFSTNHSICLFIGINSAFICNTLTMIRFTGNWLGKSLCAKLTNAPEKNEPLQSESNPQKLIIVVNRTNHTLFPIMMQNIWPKSFIGLPETLSSVPFRLWFIQTTWVTIYYTVKTHFTAFSSLTLFHYLASEPRSVLNTAPFPSNWIKRCCPPPLTAAVAATSVLPFRSVPVSWWMDDGCVAYYSLWTVKQKF